MLRVRSVPLVRPALRARSAPPAPRAYGRDGPCGRNGRTGATGATGGVTGVTLVTGAALDGANDAPFGTQVSATAACTGGKTLIGGGGKVTFTGGAWASLLQSFPSTPIVNGTWTAVGIVGIAGSGGDHITVQAFAYCA